MRFDERIVIGRARPTIELAKCDAGLASAIAVKIDSCSVSEVIGTIAGDDTVFIAVENASLQRSAIKKLLGVLGGNNV